MKPMIGKSIDQSITIDYLLVNWHRPIDDQSIITQKWSQLIDCHRLALKNSRYATFQHVRIRTRSTHECLRRFEFVHRIVCMQLNGFKNQEQKHTLTDFEQFETVFWKTTRQQHTFSLSCSFRCPFDIWLIGIFRNFIFSLFSIFPTGPVHQLCPHAVQDEIIIIWFIRVNFWE